MNSTSIWNGCLTFKLVDVFRLLDAKKIKSVYAVPDCESDYAFILATKMLQGYPMQSLLLLSSDYEKDESGEFRVKTRKVDFSRFVLRGYRDLVILYNMFWLGRVDGYINLEKIEVVRYSEREEPCVSLDCLVDTCKYIEGTANLDEKFGDVAGRITRFIYDYELQVETIHGKPDYQSSYGVIPFTNEEIHRIMEGE